MSDFQNGKIKGKYHKETSNYFIYDHIIDFNLLFHFFILHSDKSYPEKYRLFSHTFWITYKQRLDRFLAIYLPIHHGTNLILRDSHIPDQVLFQRGGQGLRSTSGR